MSTSPDKQFTELFPVPFLQYQWPDCDDLNRDLRAVILEKQESVAGRIRWRGSSIGGWHSGKDLQLWSQPCIAVLLERIDVMVRDMVTHVVPEPSPEHLENWAVQAWANVSHRGHRNRSHDHSHEPGTLWSGIYYVDAGQPIREVQTGMTVFEDWSGLPKEIIDNPNPFQRELTIQPVPGLMLMFPGRLRHRVKFYLGHTPRITIAFNLSHPGFVIPTYHKSGTKRKIKPLAEKAEATIGEQDAGTAPKSPEYGVMVGLPLTPEENQTLRNPHTRLYAAAARSLDLEFDISDDTASSILIYNDQRQLKISNAQPGCNDKELCKIARYKHRSFELLKPAGINIPKYEVFRLEDFDSDESMLERIVRSAENSYPQVIKPSAGTKGDGVFLLENEQQLIEAFQLLTAGQKLCVILEQFIDGLHYRVFTCRNRVMDVVLRIPPMVTGDGSSTLRELFDRDNEERKLYGKRPMKKKFINSLGSETETTVLDDGEEFYFSNIVNNGPTFRINLEDVHQDNIELFERIASVSKLIINGIDMIMPDVTLPNPDSVYTVNEINHAPGLAIHFIADRSGSNQCGERTLSEYFFK